MLGSPGGAFYMRVGHMHVERLHVVLSQPM